jgi:formamidopyrimidine-DNA glycosylase
MTGQLIYNGKDGIGEPHIIYTFADGSQLKHYDFRKFGYVKLIKTSEVQKQLEKEKLGPEPLEKGFTLEKFHILFASKPKAKIKPLLMDQTFLAGVGNIYAQEACFYAKVLPTRQVGTLTNKEIKELYNGLQKILKDSIESKGTSADSYVDAFGREGDYLLKLKVYGRGGQKCLRCSAVLKEAKLAGRGTVWCPKCQV